MKRIILAFFILVFGAVMVLGRAIYSAREHNIAARNSVVGSIEQVTHLKRAALFRSPFNSYAASALQKLEKLSESSDAAAQAYCDALSGSRHPLWDDSIALKRCEEPPRQINLAPEAPINFLGNFASAATFALWVLSTFGLIRRGFDSKGDFLPPFKRWAVISVATFIAWCSSLLLI